MAWQGLVADPDQAARYARTMGVAAAAVIGRPRQRVRCIVDKLIRSSKFPSGTGLASSRHDRRAGLRTFDRLATTRTRRAAILAVVGVAAGQSGVASAAAICRPFGNGCTRGGQCCSGVGETRCSAPRSRRNRYRCSPVCDGQAPGPNSYRGVGDSDEHLCATDVAGNFHGRNESVSMQTGEGCSAPTAGLNSHSCQPLSQGIVIEIASAASQSVRTALSVHLSGASATSRFCLWRSAATNPNHDRRQPARSAPLMDASRFDTLARRLAGIADRRRVVAGALALAAGGRVSGVSAACRRPGSTCKQPADCCSGICPTGVGIPTAQRGKCGCPSGQTRCSSTCVTTSSDAKHCGACNKRCATGTACCDGTCLPVLADNRNCGACGNVCPAGHTCCKGQCLDVRTDGNNCGACGKKCAAGTVCCGGVCMSVQSDPQNCGACGNSCAAGHSCCRGSCLDTRSDEANCGACAKKCAATDLCCSGSCTDVSSDDDRCGDCRTACVGGSICCDSDCEDPNNNINHCGACGAACDQGEHCCEGTCTDPRFDEANCGRCGNVCPDGKICDAGSCRFPPP